jgi:hypothetical protein
MRIAAIALAIVSLGFIAGSAESFQGQGSASGHVILWFSGTDVTATFNGTFTLTGQLVLNGESKPFTASGWARGEGVGNSSTLDIEAWATFAARGQTEAGEDVSVQGGISVAGSSANPSSSSAAGEGVFFATVFFEGSQYHAEGTAQGSGSGSLVVPEDPLSMELAGAIAFTLTGSLAPVSTEPSCLDTPTSPPSELEPQEDEALIGLLPWDTQAWPNKLLTQLLEILTHAVDPSVPPEEVLEPSE